MSGDLDATGSTADVRVANTRQVVRTLFRGGPATVADLVATTGLSRPTVSAVTTELIRTRLLEVAPVAQPSRGRPARSFEFNAGYASVAAIQIRRRGTTVVLADLRGQEHARRTVPGFPPDFRKLAHVVSALKADGADIGPLAAATLLSPGVVRRTGAPTVTLAGAGWNDEPVARDAAAALGVPVDVLTPATAALIGELGDTSGEGDPHPADRNALLVLLDRGIAASAVANGRLTVGWTAGSGEIGHWIIDPGGSRCACGRHGCLETVSSGRAIDRATRSLGGVGRDKSLSVLEDLHRPDVDGVLENAAYRLGEATALLASAHDPHLILLGGTPYAAGAHRFLDTFRRACDDRRAHLVQRDTTYRLASEDADIAGALSHCHKLLPQILRDLDFIG